jgi:hypothetical protein
MRSLAGGWHSRLFPLVGWVGPPAGQFGSLTMASRLGSIEGERVP